ncbi:hypothetical protein BCR42DRAFT_222890 [Absidia repens]|uniref:Uncharacterized protein n=1 Tax=Absidia repens TaxID=90262 RepID=A0A1X2INZ9_9FUNG|nr:hypothetical protein BCR42DRAFT_222890 [Absidia repens]
MIILADEILEDFFDHGFAQSFQLVEKVVEKQRSLGREIFDSLFATGAKFAINKTTPQLPTNNNNEKVPVSSDGLTTSSAKSMVSVSSSSQLSNSSLTDFADHDDVITSNKTKSVAEKNDNKSGDHELASTDDSARKDKVDIAADDSKVDPGTASGDHGDHGDDEDDDEIKDSENLFGMPDEDEDDEDADVLEEVEKLLQQYNDGDEEE